MFSYAYRMLACMCMDMAMPMPTMLYAHSLPDRVHTGFDLHFDLKLCA